ncbi:MAG: antibiotic biosynthesis monooxygenase [Pseudomonadota bacterium]|nr:antibiotic biosynthesis monooxygenase [Pseudomonadota bacterium]
MGFSRYSSLAFTALVLGFAQITSAQDDGTAYMVTYIEVAPFAADEAAELLTAYVQESSDADGNVRFQALQRIGRPSHFAILETWGDAEARDAHVSSRQTAIFHDNLEPLLYSPADVRPHGDLTTAAGGNVGPGGVFAVTHVDVTPNNTEVAVGLLETLASASRNDGGNARFDVLVQSNRRNHMTVVESWESPEAQEEHYGATHTKSFRASLFPLSGALYDERLYRSL